MPNLNSGDVCPHCKSGRLVEREGRYGDFVACSKFPDCKYILKETKTPAEKTGIMCDTCGEGELVVREGKFGKFMACSNYPKCKNTKKISSDGKPIESKPRSFANKKPPST